MMLAFLFSIAFLYPYTNATGLIKDSCTSITYNGLYKDISTCSFSTFSDPYKVLSTSTCNGLSKDLPAFLYKAISTCSSSTSSDIYKVLATSPVNGIIKDILGLRWEALQEVYDTSAERDPKKQKTSVPL